MHDPTANPFPRTARSGAVILDERCSCGELRTAHGTTIAFGHGPCLASGCQRFSWAGMVYATGPNALDDTHSVELRRQGNRWAYKVRDLSRNDRPTPLFSTACTGTKAQAIGHAREELRIWLKSTAAARG